MQFTVKKPAPLMDFLLEALHGKSRTGVKAMLARRLISVDHEVTTKFNQSLAVGQIVTIGKKSAAEKVQLPGVKILFDDDYVIVVEKAAGLLSVASDSGKEKSAHSILATYLRRIDHRARLFIVHRLDRDTSGVMMFVKSKELQRDLRQNWQQTVTRRSYTVVVEGIVEKDSGTIRSWLHGTDSLRTYSDQNPQGGQRAISHYKVLQRSTAFSLLEVELETGRKNQIRVHMQDIGHPVAGDEKYGATTNPLRRLALHAHVLAFQHPESGETMTFESAPPAEFKRPFKT